MIAACRVPHAVLSPCALCSALCTLSPVLRALCSVPCALCSALCTLSPVLRALRPVPCAPCPVQIAAAY